MKRNWMLGIGCVVVALVLTLGTTLLDSPVLSKNAAAKLSGETAFQLKQNVIGTSETPHEIQMIYEKDQLLGILTDEKKLEKLLADVYQKDYQKEFPDSRLALGEEIHTEYEMTNLIYEDKDEELLNYLKKNDLFSIEVNQINFSNGEVAYAKDLKDFDQAMEQYVASYLDKESYELLKKGLETPALTTYGERFIDYEVIEKIEYSKGLASISDILLNKKDATAYFAYGMEHTDEYYVTQEYDTVQGVAWLNGIEVANLMAINASVLQSENQLLAAGTELNVSKPNSPIQVKTVKEIFTSEVIHAPETKYVYDDTLREGLSETITVGEDGSKDVTYEVTYIDGEWDSSVKVKESITKNPVQEVVRVGTKIEPRVGSGSFGWPVYHPMVSCGWYCYAGHTALDIQNAYNRYDKVIASDRGVVITNSYRSVNGYYMIIDHNNGYQTYYGHMSGPGFFPVGSVVAKGEVIGNIGMTGLATGPHVHFEIRKNGRQVNPADYLY